jgi:hypothetical protein
VRHFLVIDGISGVVPQFSQYYGTPNRHYGTPKVWTVATDDYEFLSPPDHWVVKAGFVDGQAAVLSYDFCESSVGGVTYPTKSVSASMRQRVLRLHGSWQEASDGGSPDQKWVRPNGAAGATALAFGDCVVEIRSSQFNAMHPVHAPAPEPSSSSAEPPAPTPHGHGVQVRVRVGDDSVVLVNDGPTMVDCEITLNFKSGGLFGSPGGYTVHRSRFAAGATIEIPIADFATSDGVRFDPDRMKLTEALAL